MLDLGVSMDASQGIGQHREGQSRQERGQGSRRPLPCVSRAPPEGDSPAQLREQGWGHGLLPGRGRCGMEWVGWKQGGNGRRTGIPSRRV